MEYKGLGPRKNLDRWTVGEISGGGGGSSHFKNKIWVLST